jgi:hypothetical protein
MKTIILIASPAGVYFLWTETAEGSGARSFFLGK